MAVPRPLGLGLESVEADFVMPAVKGLQTN